ncbi:ABC transporter ATP-binding protein [Undibacterium sp. Ji67W]|uniref:ABC transporter ATP-binding protein n=1 Tax=Undibacterium sp. Ji67W TaxID=3413042 RepID=UPI003BF03CF0
MIRIECRKHLASATGGLQLNVQMHIERNAFVTLFGPSGAGKTTLLRMLAGLAHPDSGVIEVAGEVWFDRKKRIALPPQQRLLGLVFQDYALFPNLTVAENVAYALTKSQTHRLARLLELSGLSALQDRLPANLSGGQKQRVALARALARVLSGATDGKSPLLLLDEPLSALDVSLRVQLQDELLALHREFGLTTIMVSHDIAEVFKLSQQVFVIEAGAVVRSGSPSVVFLQQQLQGQLQLQAQVLAIRKEDVVFILSLLVGQDIVEIIAAQDEVENLRVGDTIAIAAKAFSPMIFS